MVYSSSSSKRPCSLPVLPLYGRFIESQFFCLPEFHPLVIRDESHLRSISSPPSQSPNRRTAHRSAPDSSHVSDSPTPVDVGDHLWCVHSSVLAGWGQLGTGAAQHQGCRGAQSQAVGSHKITRANTVPAEKSLSFPCCLSLLVK